MNPRKLIILRGVSGSGKSTYIERSLSKDARVCSADHYFINDQTGEYEFEASLLPRAHAACKAACEKEMRVGWPVLVIDNTNTQVWEFTPYLELAEKYGYRVEVIRLDHIDPYLAAERNLHGVPVSGVLQQARRMEPTPPGIPETVIRGI